MKNLFIILATIMCISCTNNGDNNTIHKQGTEIGRSIDITLKNSEGIDILGSDKYPVNGIVAKYLINGKIVQDINNGVVLDNPNNVKVINQGDSHFLIVFLNMADSEEYPITYIYWNATDVDTIKAQYIRTENATILEKAWLFKNNGWEVAPPDMTIVK
jgi:hypothetical protein